MLSSEFRKSAKISVRYRTHVLQVLTLGWNLGFNAVREGENMKSYTALRAEKIEEWIERFEQMCADPQCSPEVFREDATLLSRLRAELEILREHYPVEEIAA